MEALVCGLHPGTLCYSATLLMRSNRDSVLTEIQPKTWSSSPWAGMNLYQKSQALHPGGATPQPESGFLSSFTAFNLFGRSSQILDQLKDAASLAKKPGTVWMITTAEEHLKELQAMDSPVHGSFMKWHKTRRFQQLDPALATPDLVLNAVSITS